MAPIGGSQWPVMGIVQEMFYDRQKLGSPELIRAQLEEFVLHYFMRVCHVSRVRAPPPGPPAPQIGPAARDELAARRRAARRRHRVSAALLQARRQRAAIGKFANNERAAIVDLREIGKTYDWILLKVDTPSTSTSRSRRSDRTRRRCRCR